MSDSCIASWALVTVTVAATLGVESCVRHHETHVVVRHIVEASVELDVERITRLKADGSRKERQEKPAEDAGDGVWNVHAGDSSRNRRNGQ